MMRRIALYGDVHGNVPALEAVLADIASHGVEERWCAGDLVGYGPRPAEAVACVRSLGDPVVQGNWDRAIGAHLGDCGSTFRTPEEMLDGAESFGFTIRSVTPPDAGYLCSLPRTAEFEIGGARFVLCHASPRRTAEDLQEDAPPSVLIEIATDNGADAVCCAHTHVPYHRSLPTAGGTVHWVNAGSVGRQRDGDPRARWVELVIGTKNEVLVEVPEDIAARRIGKSDSWLGTRVHRVAYDPEPVVREMAKAGLPATLSAALRTGSEVRDMLAPTSAAVREGGGARLSASWCSIDSRIVSYDALAALFNDEPDDVAVAVRRLRMSMRDCRTGPHVDLKLVSETFEQADIALRSVAGRAAFQAERERMYGRAKGFDPFSNVLSASEFTYAAGTPAETATVLRAAYKKAGFVRVASLGERDPGDIAVELRFMAHCLRGWLTGDTVAVAAATDFFGKHLATWAMLFAVVTAREARDPVVRYAGFALDAFLVCEALTLRHAVPEGCDLHHA